MKKTHAKRHRRQANMKLRSHGKFKVGHKRPGGRTGSSKPGRTFKQTTAHHHVTRKARPRAFVFGGWCLADKMVDAIEAQEQLERVGALRLGSDPEMALPERTALERVSAGALAERDAYYVRLTGHEREVFDAWRRADPAFRESLKAMLTDLPPRKSPTRKAWAAKPLGAGL